MKIEITSGNNPLADLFSQTPSVEGEAEFQKLMFVEDLLTLMKEQGISRTDLARRMQIQPSRVTSMLTGTNNFTIETMVRAARAVGAKWHQKLVPEKQNLRWQIWDETDMHPEIRAHLSAPHNPPMTFELVGQSQEDAAA
jgi:plasmid maintenance system antidote protein VapI